MIFAEIDRLVNLGNSIPKAIAIMKRGLYEARMRGIKAETWRLYYLGHLRRRELQRRGRCSEQEAREQVGSEREQVALEREQVEKQVSSEREQVVFTSHIAI